MIKNIIIGALAVFLSVFVVIYINDTKRAEKQIEQISKLEQNITQLTKEKEISVQKITRAQLYAQLLETAFCLAGMEGLSCPQVDKTILAAKIIEEMNSLPNKDILKTFQLMINSKNPSEKDSYSSQLALMQIQGLIDSLK